MKYKELNRLSDCMQSYYSLRTFNFSQCSDEKIIEAFGSVTKWASPVSGFRD